MSNFSAGRMSQYGGKGCKSKNVNRSLLHPPGVHPKEDIDVGGRQITKIDYD